MRAWLGLGSNLQQPATQVRIAISKLEECEDLQVLQTSSLYRTPPWGDEEQGEFINAVVHIETSLEPEALLKLTQSIENTMGRQRERHWGPRVIDLDLLLCEDLVYHSEQLDIPHPYMHQRAFVLLPMAELDANLDVPGHGKVQMLLDGLDCSGITKGAGLE